MPDCDHIVAIKHERGCIHLSDLRKVIDDVYYVNKELYSLGFTKSKPLTPPTKYLDRRRGYFTIFSFCPICGARLNWKQIKSTM